MTARPGWLRARGARLALLAGAVAAAAGYQFQRPVVVPADGLLSSAVYRGFWGAETDHRWSRGRSLILLPDPGPGIQARLEVDLAGWRPRGQRPPLVTLVAGPGGFSGNASPRGETFRLDVTTSGWWRSDLTASIESETFQPGPGDPRELGARVTEVRLVPSGPLLAPRRPPLGQVLYAALLALLLFGLLVQVGVGERAALRASLGAAALAALAYAWARPWAVLGLRPALLAVGLALVAAHAAPALALTVAAWLAASARALARGVRVAASPAMAALALVGTLGIGWAYRAQPAFEIDLGSGQEAPVATGFGSFDRHAGATCRTALRGARLDLRDFGSGPWHIEVTASLAGPNPRRVDLLRVGRAGMKVRLGEPWFTAPHDAVAPFGWRSGLEIDIPGGSDSATLRIDRLRVERPRALPSLRVVAAALGAALALAVALGAALALAVALGAAGLPAGAGLAAAVLGLAGIVAALATDPALAVPFVASFCGIAAVGALLTALGAGATAAAGERGLEGLPSPAALGAAGLGFMGWLAATAFPLYRGGNFVFHSSISEEIWRGRFLVYYLPDPGSMLSRQAQWGSMVVPHPCLQQTLLAPLAALPQPIFYLAEKAVVAAWLACLALVASLLAARSGGPRAGAWAAATVAVLVPGYQLLGLGHLMSIFGCWAAALALGFLALRWDRLSERRTWWAAVGLLTLCFLSYFASLLFGALALVVLLGARLRREPGPARALVAAALTAAALAFALYYVNWAWPFLRESVPRILSGSSRSAADAAVPVLERLAAQPHKLAYSFGSWLVPLAGLVGLAWLARSRERAVLLAWASVLVLVSLMDVYFNFLLKHHYFVMVPVAVGVGLLLARLADSGRAGRIAAVVLFVLCAALGAGTALAVALGDIP